MKFGEKLKILRVLHGYTQLEIAKEAELLQSSIARYEKGDVVPYSSPLAKIVTALGEEENAGWLQGKTAYKLPIITVYKPLSPYQEYTSLMIRGIDVVLAELLPVFVKEIGLIPRAIQKSSFGAILIATDDDSSSGIAIVVRSEITEALFAGFPELQSGKISDTEFLDILLFTDSLSVAIKTLCLHAHSINILKSRPQADAIRPPEQVLVRLCGNGITDDILEEIKAFSEELLKRREVSDVIVNVERQRPTATIEQLLDPKLLKKINNAGYSISDNQKVI